jgi:hypothetical protein
MRTHLLVVLLIILMVVAKCAFGDDSSALCTTLEADSVFVSKDESKGRVLHELVGKASPDVPIAICLNYSERYRVAHSSSLLFRKLGLVLGHILQFNKDFYDSALIEVLIAATAHEIVHRKDVEDGSNQGDCLNQLQTSIAAYTECELEVDIRAAALGGVGSCSMLESLRFIRTYWEQVAPKEKTILSERISWFEQHRACNTD